MPAVSCDHRWCGGSAQSAHLGGRSDQSLVVHWATVGDLRPRCNPQLENAASPVPVCCRTALQSGNLALVHLHRRPGDELRSVFPVQLDRYVPRRRFVALAGTSRTTAKRHATKDHLLVSSRGGNCFTRRLSLAGMVELLRLCTLL